MSWHRPSNVDEMTASVRACYSWRAQRFGLAGESVAVLSHYGMTGLLDASHPLSDLVLTGAERYRDDYLSTGARKPHPSVTVYYVRDLRTRRAVLALQADGSILDELDTLRPDLRPATREALREAFKITRDNVTARASRGDY